MQDNRLTLYELLTYMSEFQDFQIQDAETKEYLTSVTFLSGGSETDRICDLEDCFVKSGSLETRISEGGEPYIHIDIYGGSKILDRMEAENE